VEQLAHVKGLLVRVHENEDIIGTDGEHDVQGQELLERDPAN
jgi:hypothetical protein